MISRFLLYKTIITLRYHGQSIPVVHDYHHVELPWSVDSGCTRLLSRLGIMISRSLLYKIIITLMYHDQSIPVVQDYHHVEVSWSVDSCCTRLSSRWGISWSVDSCCTRLLSRWGIMISRFLLYKTLITLRYHDQSIPAIQDYYHVAVSCCLVRGEFPKSHLFCLFSIKKMGLNYPRNN